MSSAVNHQTPCVSVAPTSEALAITACDVRAGRARGGAPVSMSGAVGFGPLPRTSTGKLRKESLRERAKAVE